MPWQAGGDGTPGGTVPQSRAPYTRALLQAVPKPDPSDRLDLSALMEGKASIPEEWPAPFTVDDHTQMALLDLGSEHFVRAAASADTKELAA